MALMLDPWMLKKMKRSSRISSVPEQIGTLQGCSRQGARVIAIAVGLRDANRDIAKSRCSIIARQGFHYCAIPQKTLATLDVAVSERVD